jgi:prefoldin subunit 5
LDTHQEKITALTQTIDKQQQTIEALQSQISGYQDLLSGMKQQFDQLTMLMNDIVEVNDLLLTGKIDTMTGKTLSGENLHGSAMT